jgi:hypothetical protein
MSTVLARVEERLRAEDLIGARATLLDLRRLRARLALANARFAPDWVWLLRRELRWMEQAIGDVVDTDALVCWTRRQVLDGHDERARAGLLAELSHERARAQRRLVDLLDSGRYQRMVRDLTRPYLGPEDLHRTLRREWRGLEMVARTASQAPSDEDRHRLAARLDRVRHGAELDQNGQHWADELGRARGALDRIAETSLGQEWFRHAAGAAGMRWDLLAGQLLERARQSERAWWCEWRVRFDRAGRKRLRTWMEE